MSDNEFPAAPPPPTASAPGAPSAPPPYASVPAPYGQGYDQRRRMRESRARRTIGFGVLWMVAGLLISVVTYANAQGGGVYVVAWGPVVVGLFRIVRGIVMLGRAGR